MLHVAFLFAVSRAGGATLAEIEAAWEGSQVQNGLQSELKTGQTKTPAWTLWKLPCRSCSDKAGQEVRWPLRCFTSEVRQEAAWKQISCGQHLQCYKCQHMSTLQPNTRLIMCEPCQDILRRGRFSLEMAKKWDDGSCTTTLRCNLHASAPVETTPEAREPKAEAGPEKKMKPNAVHYVCTECCSQWPENCFALEDLRLNAATGLLSLACWTCKLKAVHAEKFAARTGLECKCCKRKKLTLQDFPPSVSREILATGVRTKHKGKGEKEACLQITCTHCAFPSCWTGCGCRSPDPMLGPMRAERQWFCKDCADKRFQCEGCDFAGNRENFGGATLQNVCRPAHPNPSCHTCLLRASKPKVFGRWKDLICSECKRSGLSLVDFAPSVSKEILEQQRFKWGWKPRICRSCLT